jgi:hypothetical protein
MKRLVLSLAVLIIGSVLCGSSFAKEVSEIQTGTVSGRLVIKGSEPMKHATVYFFNEAAGPPPSAEKYWRVPTIALSADENGRFHAELPKGTYYMGAIQKRSGEPLGPPEEGDYFYISQDSKGNPKKYAVRAGKTMDMGTISGAKPFKRSTLITKGVTKIEGTIRNEKGEPQEGMMVFAFSTPVIAGRPLFVSERSDKNGKYLLRVSGGGKFFLRARANFGGGPQSADELMGVYNDGKPVIMKTSATKTGIDITVTKVGVASSRP